MSDRTVTRRVAGAVRNAVAWGIAWAALAFAAIIGMRTLGVVVPPWIDWLDALGMSVRIGVMGGITGGAFSLFISQVYRGRRLSQISWKRFGLGGALLAGLFVPTLLVLANLMTGGGLLPFSAIRSDIVLATLFGGIAAGGSMWLAQRAERSPRARQGRP
jgi:hypothetical protein